MTTMGTVKNGVIVPDHANQFREGARVELTAANDMPRGATFTDIEKLNLTWAEGYPGEFSDLAAQVQEDREEDLRLQIQRERNGKSF